MKDIIRFGARQIERGQPVLVVAEIGVNHNGSPALARRLVKAAANAGADAVKFQLFKAEMLTTRMAETAPYQWGSTSYRSQFDMLRKYQLPLEDLKKLIRQARQLGMEFFVSVFDELSLKDALSLGVPVLKLGSGELTNLPLVRKVARTRRTIVMSTGMSDLDEIAAAVKTARAAGCNNLCLMHCISAYPARLESLNLLKLPELKRKFHVPVGFSDHSEGNIAALGAVALGACIVEKHFTLNRNSPGPDQKASTEPGEFKRLVEQIRDVERCLGAPEAKVCDEERAMRAYARKSIVAARSLKEGTRLTERMLTFKRPGTGISPALLGEVLGKTLRCDVPADTILSRQMLR